MSNNVPTGMAAEAIPATIHTGRRSRPNFTPYLMIAPVVLIVLFGVFYGLTNVLHLSTQQYLLTRPNDIYFVGFDNYTQAFADSLFWRSLTASVIWVIGSIVPQFILGMILALLLNEKFAGRSFFRTITIAPWAVSGVVTGIMWLWIFDGTIGVLNDILFRLNAIERPIAWGIHANTTWLMLFITNAWRGTPFFAIMFLAALQGISHDLYESADIDGANAWKKFWYITLPLIRPTIILTTLLRAIWTFNFIDIIFTMTQGGPVGATRTLAMYLYDVAFIKSDFGYAATLAVITCVILLVFSLIYWRLGGAENSAA